MIRHPIFVVGMPRSGTTLLSAVLDAHSQISISPETHFYTRCRSASAPAEPLRRVWARLQQQPGFRDMAFSDDERRRVWERLRDRPDPTPPALLRAVEETYAERSGATAWGEKTPDHLPHVPTLLRDFPDAVALAIVRDPRDVCLSLRGLPWNQDTLPESAWKWRRYAQLTEQFADDYGDRFLEVRYEDLLSAPEKTLRRVLDWLDAPFEDELLSLHRRGAGPADPEREPWKEKADRPIDPTNKEKWRGQMGPAERWGVQVVTRPLLLAKGYPAPPVPLTRAFFRNLGDLLLRSLKDLATRLLRRWRTPSREEGDHRPRWIRQSDAVD